MQTIRLQKGAKDERRLYHICSGSSHSPDSGGHDLLRKGQKIKERHSGCSIHLYSATYK